MSLLYVKYNKNPQRHDRLLKNIPIVDQLLPDVPKQVTIGPLSFNITHFETCTSVSLKISVNNPRNVSFIAQSDYSEPSEDEQLNLNGKIALWLDKSNIVYTDPDEEVIFEGLHSKDVYSLSIGYYDGTQYYHNTLYFDAAFLEGELISIGVKDVTFKVNSNRNYPIEWSSDHNNEIRTMSVTDIGTEYIDHIGEMNIVLEYEDMSDSEIYILKVPIYAHWKDTQIKLSGTTCIVLPVVDIYNEAVRDRLYISISLQDATYFLKQGEEATFCDLTNDTEYDVDVSVSLEDAKSQYAHRIHTYGIYVQPELIGSNKVIVKMTQKPAWYETFIGGGFVRTFPILLYRVNASAGTHHLEYFIKGTEGALECFITVPELIPFEEYTFVFRLEECFNTFGEMDCIATLFEKSKDVVHPEEFDATVTGRTITIKPIIFPDKWNYSKSLEYTAYAYKRDEYERDPENCECDASVTGLAKPDELGYIILENVKSGTDYFVKFEAKDNDGNIIFLVPLFPTTYGLRISLEDNDIRTSCIDNCVITYIDGRKNIDIPQNTSVASEVVWFLAKDDTRLDEYCINLYEQNPKYVDSTIGMLKYDTEYKLYAYITNVVDHNNICDTIEEYTFTTKDIAKDISATLHPTGTTLTVDLDYVKSTSVSNSIIINGFVKFNDNIIAKAYFDSATSSKKQLHFIDLLPDTQYSLVLYAIDNDGNSLTIDTGSFKDNKYIYEFKTYSINVSQLNRSTKAVTWVATYNSEDLSEESISFKIKNCQTGKIHAEGSSFNGNPVIVSGLDQDSDYKITIYNDRFLNENNTIDVTKDVYFRTKILGFGNTISDKTSSSITFKIIPTSDGMEFYKDPVMNDRVTFCESGCRIENVPEEIVQFDYSDGMYITLSGLDTNKSYIAHVAITDGYNIIYRTVYGSTGNANVWLSNGFKFFKSIPYIFHNGRFIKAIPFIRNLGKWVKTK